MRVAFCMVMLIAVDVGRVAADDDPPDDGGQATAEAPAAPKPATGRFAIGVGFSTEENFIASAQVRQDDLFDTGTQLALDARMSSRQQAARLRYTVPDLLDSGLDVVAELATTRLQYGGWGRAAVGGAITIGQQLDRATRAYLRYRGERVSTLFDDPSRPDPGALTIAALGAGIEYDTRDAAFLPTRGTRIALDVEEADRRLGSSVDLVRGRASVEHARPLGPLTLRVSGQIAAVRGRGGDRVPLAERYQHGPGELPGYDLGTFGLAMDGVSGGADGTALGRVELEVPVLPRYGLSIAGFATAAADRNADPMYGATGVTLYRAVGASIIWRSPIGPLRFDWAIPLDGDDRAPRFGFGMGATW